MEQCVEPSLRFSLREQTRQQHADVERAFEAFDLKTPEGMQNYLLCHAGALKALRPIFRRNDPFGVNVDQLLVAINLDLSTLDSNKQAPTVASHPQIEPVGASYVILGSQLGARVLLSRQKESPVLEVRQADQYFNAITRPQAWKKLIYVMSSKSHSWDEELIVKSAKETFGLFLSATQTL